MGVSIEATGTARGAGWWRRPSALGLAVNASRRALRNARCSASEIDLLLYSGVYRDNTMGEPAMAPFIQHRIGANPGALATSVRRTFSFDVCNGTSGFVNALQVADGYLRTGSIKRALVVSSDVDPTPGISRGCAFEPVAAAVVLGVGPHGTGFETFGFESFEKDSNLFEGRVDWIGAQHLNRLARWRGGHALRIEEDGQYVARCAENAAAAVQRFLATHAEAARDVDLLVPSWAPAGFPDALAKQMPGDARVLRPERPGRPHSAGPGLALEAALAHARTSEARSLLLIAPGAGISVALAFYRLEQRASAGA